MGVCVEVVMWMCVEVVMCGGWCVGEWMGVRVWVCVWRWLCGGVGVEVSVWV